MTDPHVQLAFDALMKCLQLWVVAWQLRLLRRQQAALPPAKPEPLALLPPAKKPANKKPKKSAKRSRR
jgi:hypothetical protein